MSSLRQLQEAGTAERRERRAAGVAREAELRAGAAKALTDFRAARAASNAAALRSNLDNEARVAEALAAEKNPWNTVPASRIIRGQHSLFRFFLPSCVRVW